MRHNKKSSVKQKKGLFTFCSFGNYALGVMDFNMAPHDWLRLTFNIVNYLLQTIEHGIKWPLQVLVQFAILTKRLFKHILDN